MAGASFVRRHIEAHPTALDGIAGSLLSRVIMPWLWPFTANSNVVALYLIALMLSPRPYLRPYGVPCKLSFLAALNSPP